MVRYIPSNPKYQIIRIGKHPSGLYKVGWGWTIWRDLVMSLPGHMSCRVSTPNATYSTVLGWIVGGSMLMAAAYAMVFLAWTILP